MSFGKATKRSYWLLHCVDCWTCCTALLMGVFICGHFFMSHNCHICS